MKYELSETEYLETLALVRHIFDASIRAMENVKAPRARNDDDDQPWPDEWPATWPDEKTESETATPPMKTDPSKSEESVFGTERFQKGENAFDEFIDAWIYGLSLDDKAATLPEIEQPDRGALIRDLANGTNVLNVLAYVGRCGGLTNAIDLALQPDVIGLEEETRRAFVQSVATVVCATASLLFPELSDHYEHRDIYKGKPL